MLGNNGLMPIERLHAIGAVVDDLQRSMREFSRFFGIKEWEVRRLETGNSFGVSAGGRDIGATLLWARGGTHNLKYDLVQPISGNTIYHEFLNRRGPGVQDITTNVLSPAEFEAVLPKLKHEGIGVLQSLRFGDVLDIHYLDSACQIGTVVKVLVPRKPGGETMRGVPVDEIVKIDPGPDSGRIPLDKPYHVCLITRGRRDSVRARMKHIFGIQDWFEYDTHAGITSSPDGAPFVLESAHYLGQTSEHRFRHTCGRRQFFSVEIVEMLRGDCDYQRMLDTKGEGIHHVMTTICERDAFEAGRAALATEGYSVVQDGGAGPIYYCYLAAPGKLADLKVEAVCAPKEAAAQAVAQNMCDGFWSKMVGPDY